MNQLCLQIKGNVIKGKIDIYEEYIKEEENLNKEKINLEIIHLIFGDDNSDDIKEYFNKQTIDYIRNAIIVSNQVKFDLIESFKDFLINNSTFLEGSRFKKDDFEIKKEQENAGIYLTKKKDIKLKGVSKDERGFCNFQTNMPEPNYYYNIIEYENNKYLEINIESYGNIEIDDNIFIESFDNYFEIMISGKSKSDEDESKLEFINGTLKYDDFNITIKIPIKIDEINIEDIHNENKDFRQKDLKTGTISFYFKIDEQQVIVGERQKSIFD